MAQEANAWRCLEHAVSLAGAPAVRGSAAPAVSFRTRACGRRRVIPMDMLTWVGDR